MKKTVKQAPAIEFKQVQFSDGSFISGASSGRVTFKEVSSKKNGSGHVKMARQKTVQEDIKDREGKRIPARLLAEFEGTKHQFIDFAPDKFEEAKSLCNEFGLRPLKKGDFLYQHANQYTIKKVCEKLKAKSLEFKDNFEKYDFLKQLICLYVNPNVSSPEIAQLREEGKLERFVQQVKKMEPTVS